MFVRPKIVTIKSAIIYNCVLYDNFGSFVFKLPHNSIIILPAMNNRWRRTFIHKRPDLDHELDKSAIIGQTMTRPRGQPKVLDLLGLLTLVGKEKHFCNCYLL